MDDVVKINSEMSVREIAPELLQVSIKENNEVPDQVHKDIQHLQEWLKFQPHLKARNDDQFLLTILRLCKFRMQKTKEMIDRLYTLQSAIPELTYNRDVTSSEIQEILNLGIMLPIPKLASDDAPRLVVLRCSPVDISKHSMDSIVKTANMFMDLFMNEDDNGIIAGIEVVLDLSGITMNHIMHAIPFINTYRKYVRTAQKTLKFKPRGYYLLNSNAFFETLFNMFKHLLEEKHMSKIKFFDEDNWDEFKQTVPMSLIPKEYGGDGDTIAELTAHWINRMNESREWFVEQDKYGTDESLRREKISYFEENAGVEGSFKNLDID